MTHGLFIVFVLCVCMDCAIHTIGSSHKRLPGENPNLDRSYQGWKLLNGAGDSVLMMSFFFV
jgi:hypothetical protein